MLRRVLVLIAALSMGASLVFTSGALAHEISVAQVKSYVENFAQRKVKYSGIEGRAFYRSYASICAKVQSHRVRCTIRYYSQPAIMIGRAEPTCTETIDFFYSTPTTGSYDIRFVSPQCSRD